MCPVRFFVPDETAKKISAKINELLSILSTPIGSGADEISFYQKVSAEVTFFSEVLAAFDQSELLELSRLFSEKAREFSIGLEHYPEFDLEQRLEKTRLLTTFQLKIIAAKELLDPLSDLFERYTTVVARLLSKANEAMTNQAFAEVKKRDPTLAGLANL